MAENTQNNANKTSTIKVFLRGKNLVGCATVEVESPMDEYHVIGIHETRSESPDEIMPTMDLQTCIDLETEIGKVIDAVIVNNDQKKAVKSLIHTAITNVDSQFTGQLSHTMRDVEARGNHSGTVKATYNKIDR